MEEWKDIKGCGGVYQASSMGKIRSFIKGKYRILSDNLSNNGYYVVSLGRSVGSKTVHRLVAKTFIKNKYKKEQVNHKNGIKTDNRVENLEWCTKSENQLHAYKMGLTRVSLKNHFKTNHPSKGKFGKDHQCSKAVLQYTMNGDFVREFGSTTEVTRELGYFCQNIGACCNGKIRQSNGFIWKYK